MLASPRAVAAATVEPEPMKGSRITPSPRGKAARTSCVLRSARRQRVDQISKRLQSRDSAETTGPPLAEVVLNSSFARLAEDAPRVPTGSGQRPALGAVVGRRDAPHSPPPALHLLEFRHRVFEKPIRWIRNHGMN